MTTLPFSEEIRFARQQSEEAAAATALLHQVQATLQSLAITQRQHTGNAEIQPEVPGERLLSDVITRWPALAVLRDIGANAGSPYVKQIAAAKLQHETILAHLRPITAEEHERAHRLSHLQADQQRAMAAPEWAEVAEKLRDIGLERDKLAISLAGARQKVAIVSPTQTTLKAYLKQIHKESASRSGDTQLRERRIIMLVSEGISRVRSIAAVSNLEIGIPDPIETESTLPRIQDSIEELEELLRAVEGQLRTLEQEAERQQSTFDKLTAELLGQLG